jgi:hypothetical protein
MRFAGDFCTYRCKSYVELVSLRLVCRAFLFCLTWVTTGGSHGRGPPTDWRCVRPLAALMLGAFPELRCERQLVALMVGVHFLNDDAWATGGSHGRGPPPEWREVRPLVALMVGVHLLNDGTWDHWWLSWLESTSWMTVREPPVVLMVEAHLLADGACDNWWLSRKGPTSRITVRETTGGSHGRSSPPELRCERPLAALMVRAHLLTEGAWATGGCHGREPPPECRYVSHRWLLWWGPTYWVTVREPPAYLVVGNVIFCRAET